MPFNELAKIALLGTEHSHFSDTLLRELGELGLDTKKDPTFLLAEASALFTQMKKAGFTIAEFEGEYPEPIALTEETECSLKSVNHLRLILEGKYAAVFPEFLHHLLENGKRLPAEFVPSLMQLPDINEWWDLIELGLSRGGKWLVMQHPTWKLRLASPTNIDWETSSKADRLVYLNQLRRENPQQAIALLESTWLKEDFRDRAAFVKVLKNELSESDEPFLEKALQDSRKEVRMEAAALLAHLPLSNYSDRMFDRALDCLFYEKRKWQVHIPEEPDEAALADCILNIHPDWSGAKASYLGQIFSKIPPSRWEMHFEAEPEEVLNLLSKNDWSETLLKAIAKAAILHEDEKWIGELGTYWFEDEDAFIWEDIVGGELLQFAPSHFVNRLAIKTLSSTKALPTEDALFYYLLDNNNALWDNELTLLLINRIQDWLAKFKGQPWQVSSYKKYLHKAALRCDPILLASMQKGWDIRARIWYDWEKEVEEMLNTVLFRKEMIAELEAVLKPEVLTRG